jgi:4-hydroxy-2-oxoheptanedioate aldolase
MAPIARQMLAADRPMYNGWLTMPTSWSAEVLQSLGVPTLTLDLQHGMIDDPLALQILQTVDQRRTPLFARMGWNDPAAIMKVLDRGAAGVIAPLINTAADAQQLVAACRYPPLGARSFGPARVALAHGVSGLAEISALPVVMPMIETAEAFRNLESIAAVPGIDGLYVGPSDLSISLGLPFPVDFSSPDLLTALDRVVAVCRAHQLTAGIFADVPHAALLAARGFKLITVFSDGELLRQAAVAALQELD